MEPKKKRSQICSVPGCGVNKRIRPEVGFFSLPKDPRRAECWLDQICVQKKSDRSVNVCEEHFEEALINRTNPSKRRLDLDAVPTLKLPSRAGTIVSTSSSNSDSNTEQTNKPSRVRKRKNTENGSPQPEKIDKIPSRSLHGGAVLSLQDPAQSTSSKLHSLEHSKPSSSPRDIPTRKTAPLKFIEYVYKGGNDSKPKVQDDKLVKPSANEINEVTKQSPFQPTKLYHEETPQETGRPIINCGATTSLKIVQATPALQEQVGSDGQLQEKIKGASMYTLKLQEIRKTMAQTSNSSKAFKQLCLKLYLRFPNEYKALHKLLDAPPKSELRDVFNDSIITTEGQTLFTIYLTHKAKTMTVKQKQCILCTGESKIRPRIYYDIKKDHLLGIHDLNEVLKPEPATTAVVMILQGIFDEWKLPIAVGYLGNNSPSTKPWVDKIIKNIFKIGFNVRALVSHEDSNDSNKEAHISKKLICINDISFLFKSFYFNFIKFGYTFDDHFVCGQHIMDYYKLDSNKKHPLSPKLTEEILNPTNFEELNIKSVMEVFSTTTAAAISAYIDFNALNDDVKPTVDIIMKMSKLYDILNSTHLDDKSKKGFTGEQSQINFLSRMLKLFDRLELGNCDDASYEVSHKNVVEKFKVLIKCMLTLWDSFKHDRYDYLPFWRFNTNAVDLFFDEVQKHSKSLTKPTAKEVYSIFRQTAIIHLLKNPVKKFAPICVESTLTEFQTISMGFRVLNDDYINLMEANIYKITSSEYMKLEIEKKDGIKFLAGFLLKKCIDIHECNVLKNYNFQTLCDVEALSMCESIMGDVQKNICALPSAEFIEFVEVMEISFRTFFNKEVLCALNRKILNSLINNLDLVEIRMPCPCFPLYYAKRLYLRFRIYHMLKYNNELIKTKIYRRLIVNKL